MSLPHEVDAALRAIAAGATADSRESQTLDFERGPTRSRADAERDLVEAASCMANARGGVVVVGVEDRVPGAEAFTGTTLDAEELRRAVHRRTSPPLTVEVVEHQHDDTRLLLVTALAGLDVHQVQGRAVWRVGPACEPMSASQIAAVTRERRGYDWTAEPSGLRTDSLSPVAMQQARTLLRNNPDPRRQAYASATDEDLVRRLGLTAPDGTLNNAGALLLCEAPDPADDLLVYQYRRTAAGEPADLQRLGAPLLTSLLRVFELVEARVDDTAINLPTGQQLHLADLPEAVIREGLANAVMHRDYRREGAVQVEHAPTRLVITSPGPLVQGATVDDVLTTVSRPRNVTLTVAIRTVGLAEQAEVGVDRTYRDTVRVGHQPPRFESEADQVRVTLLGGAPNRQLARFTATVPAAESDDADTMLVLHALLSRRTVSVSTLSPVLQKADEVETVLRRIEAPPVSLIEPTRTSARRRHPEYRLREHVVGQLGPAVTYRRRTPDEHDRKVVALPREVGEVNRRLVKMMLDLSTTEASRLLGDLVRRGLLVKTSRPPRHAALVSPVDLVLRWGRARAIGSHVLGASRSIRTSTTPGARSGRSEDGRRCRRVSPRCCCTLAGQGATTSVRLPFAQSAPTRARNRASCSR